MKTRFALAFTLAHLLALNTFAGTGQIGSSDASENTQADRGSLRMVNDIIQGCPAEFSQAMQGVRILNLTVNESKNSKGQWVRTSVMSTGIPSSLMNPREEVLNVVTVISTESEIQPADAFTYNTVCALKKL